MVHRIICSAVILTLGLTPHQLQASPLNFTRNFFEQPLVQGGIAPLDLEMYPPGAFPDFVAALTKPWPGGPLPGNGDSLGFIIFPKPSALLANYTATLTKTPALSPMLPNPSKTGNLPNRVKSVALNHLHAPYKRGGSLQTGRSTDCSGFVRHVYQNFQIELPHSSAQQARLGKVAARSMDFSKLEIGDLLFFRRARSIDHVGIYMGEGQMIHASSRRRSVILTNLQGPYYAHTFVVAKRLLEKPQP